MYTFIEFWKAKQAWLDLPTADREAYMGQLGPTIPGFVERGVEIGDWGWNDSIQDHRADYDFFAVWRIPNLEILAELTGMLQQAGWYNYFEQINVCGTAGTPQDMIGKMISL